MQNKWVKKVFSDTVINAIFKRKTEVNKPVTILSKLLEAYGMAAYRKTAEKLILGKEVSDEFAEVHVTFDFMHGDFWLDLEALYFYRDILEGFIGVKEYQEFIGLMQSEENIRKIQNQALRLYQEKSIGGLIKTMITERKHRNMFPDETALCMRWCLLELLSRTRLPKVCFYLKGIPMRIKIDYTGNALKRAVLADMR